MLCCTRRYYGLLFFYTETVASLGSHQTQLICILVLPINYCFEVMVPHNCSLCLCAGFHIIFLPYADDKRNVDFTEKVPASREQVDKMKEIIQKLRFKYRYMEINSVCVGVAREENNTLLLALLHMLFSCGVHQMAF